MSNPYNDATNVVKKLVRHGYTAYFAGGWVRDYLLGHPSSDIDIATNAPPQKILDLFPKTILVGLTFGVVIVTINGHQFEISTFRRDIDYRDGRKPDRIELADAREDALRRDFTINGMFYDPIDNVIHDYVQGQSDLKKGIIRSIGNPYERFFEDRLRMIRAIRFAARFGFSIDIDTQNAILENADSLFPAVALERVWQEFNKMSDYPHFGHALAELHRLRLLPNIFPELTNAHLNDIRHYGQIIDRFPLETPTILKLAELFPQEPLESLILIFKNLKTSNLDLTTLEFARNSQRQIFSYPENLSPVDWVQFYAHPMADLALILESQRTYHEQPSAFLAPHQQRKHALKPHIERALLRKQIVTSSLLKSEGIPPGKIMGDLIREAEKIAILHNLVDPQVVLKMIKQTPLWPK